eukprot:SAG31_NODE_56_length_29726_cov_41.443312_25_plen_88_part_00
MHPSSAKLCVQGREGKGREGKGREGKGREGKGSKREFGARALHLHLGELRDHQLVVLGVPPTRASERFFAWAQNRAKVLEAFEARQG